MPSSIFKFAKDTGRDEIKKHMKKTVWDLHAGNVEKTLCICCNEIITKRNFHTGHIIADSKNGIVNSYNLRPICMHCNTSMNNTNMFDYMLNNKVNIDLALEMSNIYNRNKKLFQKE